jgi:hypothetical protein
VYYHTTERVLTFTRQHIWIKIRIVHGILIIIENIPTGNSSMLLSASGWQIGDSLAKNISVRAEWLCQSGRAPSEPSETPWWRITARRASIQRVAFQIAL